MLKDKIIAKKDPQTIFVTTWHPKLSKLSSIIKSNFHVIKNDPKLSKIFIQEPLVAFNRKKSIANYVTRTDICSSGLSNKAEQKCNRCNTCKLLNTDNTITNIHANQITKNVITNVSCKVTNVIYAAKCKKHDLIYIGHTGEKLSERFSKHKYDVKKRPDNSELASHFHENHDFDRDLEISVLQIINTDALPMRVHYEDRWICALQTLQPTGLNTEINSYAKEMYCCFKDATQ